MNADFIKVLNVEVIKDELSLDDIKGGLSVYSKPCCKGNTGCNTDSSCGTECCDYNSGCNVN